METKKNLYIINPPCFEEFNTERNMYSTDGILSFLTSIDNKAYNITYYDYSISKENILKLFEHIQRDKPDVIFLNLNEYEIHCNVHLSIGIKSKCPTCKLIVGCKQDLFNNISEQIKSAVDEWFYYDDNRYRLKNLSLLDLDGDIFFTHKICYRFCDNKNLFTPIFHTKNGFLNRFCTISENSELFISFRFFEDCDFDVFYCYVKDLKERVKKLKFIIDGGCFLGTFSREDLGKLKKLGLIGIVYTLDSISGIYPKWIFASSPESNNYDLIKSLKVLFRVPTTELSELLEFYDKELFIELTWNNAIPFDKFYTEKKLLMFNFLAKILFKHLLIGKALNKLDFPIGHRRKYYKNLLNKIRYSKNCEGRMDIYGLDSFSKKTF